MVLVPIPQILFHFPIYQLYHLKLRMMMPLSQMMILMTLMTPFQMILLSKVTLKLRALLKHILLLLRKNWFRKYQAVKFPAAMQQKHSGLILLIIFFALKKSQESSDGLNPMSLYYLRIFVWLPEFLDKGPITV